MEWEGDLKLTDSNNMMVQWAAPRWTKTSW